MARRNQPQLSQIIERLIGKETLKPSRRNTRSAKRSLQRHLCCESLEARRLLAGIPVLNSNPGASASLYLDFDGHFEATWGSYSNITTPALDFDSNPSAINAEEDQYIRDAWAIVAEDYAPFNINVTTVEPAILAPGVPNSAANGVALRVAIGGTSAVMNDPNIGGGIAGLGAYNSFTNSRPNVAYVFPESSSNVFRSAIVVGSISSHEAGHSFGLRHQTAAYDVAAKWQGIMLSTELGYEDSWWTAGTDDLGNYQDDMAMLSNSLNGFSYRADDHAGTIAAATPLAGSGTDFSGSGIIGVGSDVDMWSLTTAETKSLRISVAGSAIGQNLDAVIDFLDASGNVILTANPTNSYDAEMIVEAAGTKYIAVRGTGEYGRIGQYTISVAASLPGVSLVSPVVLKTSETGVSDSFTISLNSKPTSNVIIPISSSDTTEGTVSSGSLVFTPSNWYLPQTITVLGQDDALVDGVVQYAINLGPVVSTDDNYGDLAVSSLAASNVDDDAPGSAFQLEGTLLATINDMQVAMDGSMFVTGDFSGTVDFDLGSGITALTSIYATSGFIARYSPSQELLWVRQFGATGGSTYSLSLAFDSSGNPYLTGYTSSPTLTLGSTVLTTKGLSDAYVAKLDSNGNFVWARSWGGISSDYARSLLIDANDRLHVGGAFTEIVDFNPAAGMSTKTSAGMSDAYVSRFDSNGNFLGVTSYGGIENDYLRDLVGDSSGNIYAGGYFYGTSQFGAQSLTAAGSGEGRGDGYFVKLNSTGSIEWARQAVSDASSGTSSGLAVTSNGDVYYAASFSGDVNFGAGTPTLTSVNGGIVLTKWDTQGNLLQTGQISGDGRVSVAELAVDATNQLVMYGTIRGTVDLDPTSQTVTRTSSGATASFILRLDADTQFLDFYQMPQEGAASQVALTIDTRGNIYAAGWFGTAIAMPTGQRFVNAAGSRDAYVLKLAIAPGVTIGSSTGLATSENGGTASFSVVLDIPPTEDVTIAVSSGDLTEGTVSTPSLTFTPTNWNIPQTVTITGVDDALIDGDVAYTILLGSTVSADPRFQGLNPTDVSVSNIDNDLPSTKFYVVNDGSPDRTYEYGATGTSIENYTINSGNTQPRGAASNAAGTTVWVADKNRKVYVYDTSGGSQGSWSAGTLAWNAVVEGVATNGTDVWIVDSKSDKVYRYTGAASRTAGSQNAASSFSLNRSNTSPKGIVTDGTYLWVVNSSSSDKVFKYTLSGSLVGSWTIDSANKSPTGLTIDPTGVSQSIWIVDSGTDKVYEYTSARGRTSGSQSAAIVFALAAGNTNPQGIADPPPAGSTVNSARLPAVQTASQTVSPMAPPVAGNQAKSTENLIADELQRKSLIGYETIAVPFDLQSAASRWEGWRSMAHVSVQSERSKASAAKAREDIFFLDDSFDGVDDDLLSLLAQR